MIRTAFVLGAGLGTRLRPLTLVRPKPLIPVANRPLVTWAFDHLLAHGIGDFVINTHWLHEAWAREFPEERYRRATLRFRHEPEILETGGGLKNVEDLLRGETILIYNGDVFTDLPLAPAFRLHREAGHEVTMILRSGGGPRQVRFDAAAGRITGFAPADEAGAFLFTGLYVVSPAFLTRLVAGEKRSVIPVFKEMIAAGAAPGGVVIDDGEWWDLGSRDQYLAVHRQRPGGPWIAGETAGAEISGGSAVGAGARIGAGARLRDTIVWPGAEVAAGSVLERCIVTGLTPVSGVHTGADL